MRIAIELHGTVRHGCWSAERGESRWAQNIAAVLATAGHEVIGFGPMVGDGWGICPKVEGLTLVDWRAEKDLYVDVLIDTAHWRGKPVNVHATHVLLGYFGAAFGEGSPIEASWPRNWHLVLPWYNLLPLYETVANPQRGNMEMLPYVLLTSNFWESRAKGMAANPFVDHPRDRVLWGSKDPFGVEARQRIDDPLSVWADLLLSKMAWLAKSAPALRPTFLGGGSLEPSYSEAAAHYAAKARVDVMGGTPYGIIPYGPVLQLMRESVIMLTTPIWGSIALECVLEGCLPLVWDTNEALRDAAHTHDLLMPVRGTPAQLDHVIAQMLDPAVRESALKGYQAALAAYSMQTTLDCWKAIEARWL